MVSPREEPRYKADLVRTAEERSAVFAIRMRVFVEEQNVPLHEEWDAYDNTAVHFLARTLPQGSAEALIVGTARLVDKGQGVGKVGRVAILQEHRGKGVGALIMRFIEQFARDQHCQRLILDAQCYAIPFYEKLGYAAEGDIFLDANIEHRFMSLVLT